MGKTRIIAAIGAKSRVIGRDNDLPWTRRLSPDLHRFKRLTEGGVVIMGRITWDSLPPQLQPLPDRVTYVVSQDPTLRLDGARVFPSLVRALDIARAHEGDRWIAGGAMLYIAGLTYADQLDLTLVGEDPPGDTFFPEYEHIFNRVLLEEVEPDFVPELRYVTLGRG